MEVLTTDNLSDVILTCTSAVLFALGFIAGSFR